MKVRYLFTIIFLAIFAVSGCGTVNVASRIGGDIGKSFQGSSERIISAADAIKSWPAVSGLIRGTLASNYNLEIPMVAQQIISELDTLAAKETLTEQEKGTVIGYFIRLEYIAASEGWDRYGVSIVSWIRALIG